MMTWDEYRDLCSNEDEGYFDGHVGTEEEQSGTWVEKHDKAGNVCGCVLVVA